MQNEEISFEIVHLLFAERGPVTRSNFSHAERFGISSDFVSPNVAAARRAALPQKLGHYGILLDVLQEDTDISCGEFMCGT